MEQSKTVIDPSLMVDQNGPDHAKNGDLAEGQVKEQERGVERKEGDGEEGDDDNNDRPATKRRRLENDNITDGNNGTSDAVGTPATSGRKGGAPRKTVASISSAVVGASTAAPLPTPSKPGRKKDLSRQPAPSTIMTPERREANRLAAERSRNRRADRAHILEIMAKGLANENEQLKERVRGLVAMGVNVPGLDVGLLTVGGGGLGATGSDLDGAIGQENDAPDKQGKRSRRKMDKGSKAAKGKIGRPRKSDASVIPPEDFDDHLAQQAQGPGGQDESANIDPSLHETGEALGTDSQALQHEQMQALMDMAAVSSSTGGDATNGIVTEKETNVQQTLPGAGIGNGLSDLADAAAAAGLGARADVDTNAATDVVGPASQQGSGIMPSSTDVRAPQHKTQDRTAHDDKENILPKPKLSLHQEMETFFRSEVEMLQAEVEAADADSSMQHTVSDDIQPRDLTHQAAELDVELKVLYEIVARVKEDIEAAKVQADGLRREVFELEVDDVVDVDEGEEKRSKVLKAREGVENALIDVKKHVNLMLSFYNPAFIPTEIPAAEAFTLPQKFEAIPLPEPQKRGRPANPLGRPASARKVRKVKPSKPPAPPKPPRVPKVASASSRRKSAPRNTAPATPTTPLAAGEPRSRKKSEPSRRYRMDTDPGVLYIEQREIPPGSTEEIVKVKTRNVYNPRPNSSAGRRKKNVGSIEGQEEDSSEAARHHDPEHGEQNEDHTQILLQAQQHDQEEEQEQQEQGQQQQRQGAEVGEGDDEYGDTSLYEAAAEAQNAEDGLEALPSEVAAYPTPNLSYGQVSTLLAAAGVTGHEHFPHLQEDGQDVEVYQDYIIPTEGTQ